jgi:hypothetical protein
MTAALQFVKKRKDRSATAVSLAECDRRSGETFHHLTGRKGSWLKRKGTRVEQEFFSFDAGKTKVLFRHFIIGHQTRSVTQQL